MMKFSSELRCCSLMFAILFIVRTASGSILEPERCMPPAFFFDNGPVKHCAIIKNEYALRGETIKLPCGQIMQSEYPTWYKNGQRIDFGDRMKRDKLGEFLIIKPLELEDTGVYTCLAWYHQNFYQIHSYSLEVQSLPYFTFTPENANAVKGQTVNFRCQANGAPKPTIKWLKYDRKLYDFDRYMVSESGDLQIQNVSSLWLRDAGEYTCIATNEYGSAKATASLEVKQFTEIVSKLEDRELNVRDTARFRCDFRADPSLRSRIDWLKNGEPIDFQSETRIFLSDGGTVLTIMKLNELDAGKYTCVVNTDIDQAKAEANLVVHGGPKPPTILGVDCGAKEVRVSWNATSDDRWPITHYTIEYSTFLSPSSWEIIQDHIPASDQSYNVKLISWTDCIFRVIAWNQMGASQPSPRSPVCEMTPDIPYKNPDNVEAKEEWRPFHHLNIKWTAMSPTHHGAYNFKYRVYYKRDIPGENWTETSVDDWRQHEFKIKTDSSYQRYRIKVTASNEKGDCKELPQEIVGIVGKDAPLQAPGNFTLAKVIGGTKALVSWTKVFDETVRLESRGYTIETWADIDGGETVRSINVNGVDKTSAIIDKLVPQSKNYFRIRAYDERGNGPPSKVISIDTSIEMTGSGMDLQVYAVGSTAMELKWSKPIAVNGTLWHYKITFQKVNESIVEREMEKQLLIEDAKVTSARLLGLSPRTSYRINIRAISIYGDESREIIEGEPSSVQNMTRAARRPNKPSFSLHKIPQENGLVDLSIVRHVKEDDILESFFFVEYKMLDEKIRKKTHLEKEKNEIVIPSFKKGHHYIVYVIAFDGEYFVESDPLEVTI